MVQTSFVNRVHAFGLTGVVDQYVDVFPGRGQVFVDITYVFAVGDVDLQQQGFRLMGGEEFGAEFFEAFPAATKEDEAEALGGEAAGGSPADAAGCPGDKYRFSVAFFGRGRGCRGGFGGAVALGDHRFQ